MSSALTRACVLEFIVVQMGREWVLDTDTKGTGAQMRPLDSVLRKPEPAPDLALVRRKPAPPPAREPEPPKPRRFKVVDVMSRQVRAEHADARTTVEALAGVRSLADVQVHVWEHDAERWRRLTLDEQRALWGLRDQVR